MLYGDEEIIAMRVAARNKAKHSIVNKVKIDGETYRFGEREISPYFSMVLPESFEELADEYVLLKYPNINRPKIILSSPDTLVNFSFDHLPEKAEELNVRVGNCKATDKRLHPSYVFFSEGIETTVSGLEVAYYDYRGIAVDADFYCFKLFADLPDTGLFGCFNCPIELRDKWEPLVRQMIKTIKSLNNDTEEEKDA